MTREQALAIASVIGFGAALSTGAGLGWAIFWGVALPAVLHGIDSMGRGDGAGGAAPAPAVIVSAPLAPPPVIIVAPAPRPLFGFGWRPSVPNFFPSRPHFLGGSVRHAVAPETVRHTGSTFVPAARPATLPGPRVASTFVPAARPAPHVARGGAPAAGHHVSTRFVPRGHR